MSDEFDKLQEIILEDARKIYSETVIDHAMNSHNLGEMEDADGFARIVGPCGDTMEIWIKVSNDSIVKTSFMTDGCGTSAAAGSMVTELARGRNILEAQRITQQDILTALGGLPDESVHCALLASNTLKAAIRDYIIMKRDPWKKAYRKKG